MLQTTILCTGYGVSECICEWVLLLKQTLCSFSAKQQDIKLKISGSNTEISTYISKFSLAH